MFSARRIHRPTVLTALVCALVVPATGVPAATAMPIDGPAHTSGLPGTTSAPKQDLRSPDARDAAQGRTTRDFAAPIVQDLRSPDARDAADGRSTADMATPVVEITRADGFDWSDAAVGAGGATGLLAISLAGAMTLRRRETRTRSSTAVS
jgi:hypothetical protein